MMKKKKYLKKILCEIKHNTCKLLVFYGILSVRENMGVRCV